MLEASSTPPRGDKQMKIIKEKKKKKEIKKEQHFMLFLVCECTLSTLTQGNKLYKFPQPLICSLSVIKLHEICGEACDPMATFSSCIGFLGWCKS